MAQSKTKTSLAPPEKVAQYERMVASIPEVELKGATMPNTTHNGNMFSFLHASGEVALRLSNADREAVLNRYATKLFDAYGIVQKEYIVVPNEVMEEPTLSDLLFAKSWAYVQTLKPKKAAK